MQKKYVHGCRSEFLSACINTAPVANNEALVMMEKGRVTSGIHRTGADEKIYLRRLNTHCWSWVHTQGSPLQVSRLRGATMLEKSGIPVKIGESSE